MGTLSHIVVGVDGSNESRHAEQFALELARREQATISMCSVVDDVHAYAIAPKHLSQMMAALQSDARRYSADALARAAVYGVEARSIVDEGNPADCLMRIAERQNAGAIVVGTHARRGASRLLFGSVAGDIVRHATVPVFTVRTGAQTSTDGPIVVAVDSSPPSLAALRLATALAHSQGTAVHLIHAFCERDLARIPDHLGYDPVIARRRAMTATADELDEITDRVRDAGAEFTSELCEGEPVDRTIAAAARLRARFIVTGTHARAFLGGLLEPGIAQRLVREATVPVMTLRG